MNKITRLVNDVNLNEVASLINQLESYKDDSGFGISFITIDNKAQINLHPELFFAKFSDFKARKLESEEYNYPYEFSAQVNGVTFVSLLSDKCLEDLQKTMPDQLGFVHLAIEENEKTHKKSLQALACK